MSAMKVVILAGGLGTRISEESYLRPKPMIEIGEQPILWHIMKGYSHYGFHDFVICCGYKGHMIKEYFADYYLHRSDVTFDFSAENRMTVHQNVAEPWRVTLVDTGLNSQTGARVKRVQKYIGDEPFTLGALQNRLEHTINNLGVQRENIQNAESLIRDTDVAEEMMTYTKNNILNQSAQAMLAQANQLPQGVLQLLQ